MKIFGVYKILETNHLFFISVLFLLISSIVYPVNFTADQQAGINIICIKTVIHVLKIYIMTGIGSLYDITLNCNFVDK